MIDEKNKINEKKKMDEKKKIYSFNLLIQKIQNSFDFSKNLFKKINKAYV